MKYDSGMTPVPSDSSYSANMRQEVIDGLNERISNEQSKIDEKDKKYHEIILPLCDQRSEENTQARRVAYSQNNQSRNVFLQYQKYQEQLQDLKYQQQQQINKAMAKYSGVGMRAQRDKAGAEAGAEFEDQIARMQGFMTDSLGQYKLQKGQSDIASLLSRNAQSASTSAYNDAISMGYDLASDYMDLGKLQQQRGFFEGMA